jgi:glutamate-5-semialdehyde dehydrogenase
LEQETFKSVRKASKIIKNLSSEHKTEILMNLSDAILSNLELIKVENQKDLDLMDSSDAKYDRLKLTDDRIIGLADSLKQVAESRPNVTIDVAALCIRSGNACVLKGGKEAHFSNTILVKIIHEVLSGMNLPIDIVHLLPTDRKYTEALLQATKYVDIIIPRGSDALIQYVRKNSLIPTIETGAGVCHTYVEKTADLDKAAAIIINARASRPSVCNSLDCALLDIEILEELIPKLIDDLNKWNIEIYADEASFKVFEKNNYKKLFKATNEDFGKEWLDYKLSTKTINSFEEALEHIEEYSSKHSEAILTKNKDKAERFIREVDAASVYHNASTRFTDGGEFGLGAEIGISTQKLHARGPFALEKLVTEKWVLRGDGQVRW